MSKDTSISSLTGDKDIRAVIDSTPDPGTKVDLLVEHALSQISTIPEIALGFGREALQIANEHSLQSGLAKAHNCMGTLNWFLADYETTIKHQNKALNLWRDLANKEGEAKCLTGIGNAYVKQGFNNLAMDYYLRSMKIQKALKNQMGVASLYNNLGVVFKNQGDYDRALRFYFKSLKIKEGVGVDPTRIAISYVNIGIIFFLQKDFKKSLDYYEKAQAINQEHNDDFAISDVLNNIGVLYGEWNNIPKSMECLRKALTMKTELGDKMGMTVSYQEMGNAHLRENKYEKALESYHKALSLSRETGSRGAESDFLTHIGKVYIQAKQPEKAIGMLNRGLDIRNELNAKSHLEQSYALLAKAHAQLGKFDPAYKYQVLYSETKSELFNEEKTKILHEMELKYELEQKDLEIEKLNIRQELLELANKELELFAGMAAHDMKEPLRMVHSYSGLLVRRFGDKMDGEAKEYIDIIQNASDRMNDMLVSLLEYARGDVKSKQTEEIDLSLTLEIVLNNLQLVVSERQATINVDKLPKVTATDVHMIQLFQNLVSNSIKFCPNEPPVINLSFREEGNFYHLTHQDNGIGIKPENQEKVFDIFTRLHGPSKFEGSGIGLATCRKIVESLGGKIWIQPTTEKGTTFHFTLPK
ncbi:MAG: tetratricopeptide repeat protein [Bacteroidota bacterium]